MEIVVTSTWGREPILRRGSVFVNFFPDEEKTLYIISLVVHFIQTIFHTNISYNLSLQKWKTILKVLVLKSFWKYQSSSEIKSFTGTLLWILTKQWGSGGKTILVQMDGLFKLIFTTANRNKVNRSIKGILPFITFFF